MRNSPFCCSFQFLCNFQDDVSQTVLEHWIHWPQGSESINSGLITQQVHSRPYLEFQLMRILRIDWLCNEGYEEHDVLWLSNLVCWVFFAPETWIFANIHILQGLQSQSGQARLAMAKIHHLENLFPTARLRADAGVSTNEYMSSPTKTAPNRL